MPGEYAKDTTVPAGRSFEEIKKTLLRFGADRDSLTYAERGRRVAIQFRAGNREVLLEMVLPDRESFAPDRYGRRRVETAIDRDWEQASRQRWRTLAAGIKAKLALIDDGISSFDREFLSDILLPSGRTVGQTIGPDLDEAVATGEIPSLIAGPPPAKVVAVGSGGGR